MLSKTAIRNRVLQRLGVYSQGETPSAFVAQTVEDAYDEVYHELAASDAVSWPNTDATTQEIPEAVTGALVTMVAHVAGPGLGSVTTPPFEAYRIAERRIRAAIANDYQPHPTPAEYY